MFHVKHFEQILRVGQNEVAKAHYSAMVFQAATVCGIAIAEIFSGVCRIIFHGRVAGCKFNFFSLNHNCENHERRNKQNFRGNSVGHGRPTQEDGSA
jgi:hypothetical protein